MLAPSAIRSPWRCALALVIAAAGAMYIACIDRETAGFLHDDGIYLITARSLAEGEGPRLTNLPGDPVQVRYPILYPLMLAAVWFGSGGFPGNIAALTLLSVACSLAVLALFAWYLVRVRGAPPWLALLVVGLTATSYQYVVYSTSLMSELPYLLLSLVVIVHAERTGLAPGWRPLALSVLLAALAFHTRTVGIVLVAAIVLRLACEQRWRHAFLYGAATCALTLLPWMLWTQAFSLPMRDSIDYSFVHPYGNYSFDLAARYTEADYSAVLAFGRGLHGLARALLEGLLPGVPNLLQIYPGAAAAVTGGGGLWAFVVAVELAAWALLGALLVRGALALRQRAISVAGLYVFLYCALVAFWNYENSTPRFLVVVTPWLWYWLIAPWASRTRASAVERRPIPAGAIAAFCAAALLVAWPAFLGVRFIAAARSEQMVANLRVERSVWSDYREAFAFIERQLPPNATLAACADPVFHLFTGRRALYLHYDGLRIHDGRFTERSYDDAFAALERYGVRYVVVEPEESAENGAVIPNQVAMHIIARRPHRFRLLHTSSGGLIQIFELLPA